MRIAKNLLYGAATLTLAGATLHIPLAQHVFSRLGNPLGAEHRDLEYQKEDLVEMARSYPDSSKTVENSVHQINQRLYELETQSSNKIEEYENSSKNCKNLGTSLGIVGLLGLGAGGISKVLQFRREWGVIVPASYN